MRLMKSVSSIHKSGQQHWVGDGFPVHTVFGYQDLGQKLTPFLLLDHAGPADFSATDQERGVGWHPHRGFETVSVAYQGAVDHQDSTGSRGSIGPGDVQWMTAGAGVLHKELHGHDFAARGGTFEMLQLWVNLPAEAKMTAPGYQTLLASDIPVVALPDGWGSVRVIAGQFADARGPARTFTDINLLDVRLRAGGRVSLNLHAGFSAAVYVVNGKVVINGTEPAQLHELVVFSREGDHTEIVAVEDSTLFVMNGEPIDEPIIGYGPFVMNTQQQIQQAFADFHAGRMGKIPEPA